MERTSILCVAAVCMSPHCFRVACLFACEPDPPLPPCLGLQPCSDASSPEHQSEADANVWLPAHLVGMVSAQYLTGVSRLGKVVCGLAHMCWRCCCRACLLSPSPFPPSLSIRPTCRLNPLHLLISTTNMTVTTTGKSSSNSSNRSPSLVSCPLHLQLPCSESHLPPRWSPPPLRLCCRCCLLTPPPSPLARPSSSWRLPLLPSPLISLPTGGPPKRP